MIPQHSSQSVEWYTPARFIEAAREVLGAIDLDPASCAEANDTVKARVYHGGYVDDVFMDGLDLPWHGRVWLNPPYGRGAGNKSNQEIWSQKCIAEWRSGRVTAAIMLLNAVPDRRWFWGLWEFDLCFTYHRIRFEGPDGKSAPPNGNAFVYLPNRTDDDCSRFTRAFLRYGPVVPGGTAVQSMDQTCEREGGAAVTRTRCPGSHNAP